MHWEIVSPFFSFLPYLRDCRLLDGALVELAGTELFTLRQEGVRFLVLVAAERRQRRRQGIVGGGARGTRRHWLAAIQSKLHLFFKVSSDLGLRIDEKSGYCMKCIYCLNEIFVTIFLSEIF